MEKNKKIFIASISIAILIAIVWGSLLSSGGDTKEITQVQVPIFDEEAYKSKLEAIDLDDEFEPRQDLNFPEEIKEAMENSNEHQDLSNLMNRLSHQNTPIESLTPVLTQTAAPQEPPKPKVKELTTEEKILAYRKKMGWDDPKPTAAPTKPSEPKESKPYKIAIFMDQHVLPDDLVELRLMEQIEYNGKIFERGTPLYAYITINKNRILFDIANISHVPLDIEVRDLRDGRVGMHSSRAGELWKQYQDQAKSETQDGIVETATEEVRSGILRKGIESLSSFFKRKRIRERDKILLIDDHQLLLKIKG